MGCWRSCLLLLLLLAKGSAEDFVLDYDHDYVQDMYSQDRGLAHLMALQWRCMLQDLVSVFARAKTTAAMTCYPDVTVHIYSGWPPRRKVLDPRRPGWLRRSGWDPHSRTVLLVHGFNGGAEKAPLTTLRDAYAKQGSVNVLALDWSPLARYPCYTDAVRHSRTAAGCGAQVLDALQATLQAPRGAPRSASRGVLTPADSRFTTCVGHSLGAHICGMLSRRLSHRLLKVVALDPARPQVSRMLANDALSADDAWVVQSFHSNAGFYGEYPTKAVGQANFCFNDGHLQPSCSQGSRFAQMRCSHFLSVCYFAQMVRSQTSLTGVWTTATGTAATPCDNACRRLPGRPPLAIKLTEAVMDRWRGTYCLDFRLDRTCRIDV